MTSRPDRSSNTETAAFTAVLASALQQLDIDKRLPLDTARELRRAIAATDRDARASIAFDPEKHLGPFDSLSPAARDAIVAAIADFDRWQVRGYELGEWHPLLLRSLWRLKLRAHRLKASDSRLARGAREITDVLAYGARKAPAFVLAMLHRRRLAARARLSSRPTLPEVLSLAGIQPRDLAVCYARGIPQADGYRGHWHDETRNITVGRVLGIDLLPTADGCWYVESNASPALEAKRSVLYERDPLVCSMFDFASEHGHRHLTVLDNTAAGADPRMARTFADEARARRIGLTLLELPNVPGRTRIRSYGIPPLIEDDTLVVRTRTYQTSLDYLFDMKRATYRALAIYQRETGDPDLRLPAYGSEPVLAEVAPDDPYPNVVYKLPELEQGRGVFFLKANSPEHAEDLLKDTLQAPRKRELQERVLHAFTNKKGLYQAYVKSTLLEQRRLYKVRALVLVTPVGVRFLSAHRVISGYAVPDRLDPGVVMDPRPYLINTSRGAKMTIVPEDEEPTVARAGTAVARGLAWAAEYGFRTGPKEQ